MRYLCPLLVCFSVILTPGFSSAPRELFNGQDFAGWEFVASPPLEIATVCKMLPGGVIAAAGSPVGYIATKSSYRNYQLHAEWRWTGKPGNGGVLLHINSQPSDKNWPASLQVQMKNKFVGDLLPMAGATFAEPIDTSVKTPRYARVAADSEKPAGEWNSCDVVCRDGTVEVTINGVPQNKVTAASPATGRIGFQYEGDAFELRHVTVIELEVK